jgi:hypothetical protein
MTTIYATARLHFGLGQHGGQLGRDGLDFLVLVVVVNLWAALIGFVAAVIRKRQFDQADAPDPMPSAGPALTMAAGGAA